MNTRLQGTEDSAACNTLEIVEEGLVRMKQHIPSSQGIAKAIARGNVKMKSVEWVLKALPFFIATPPYRGWQRSEGRFLLHSFLSLDMFVAFSILRFGTSAKSVSWVGFES